MKSVSTMTEEAPIVLRVLSQPQYLCVVRAAVEQVADRLGMNEKDAALMVMAVDEAMTNTIRHAYRGRNDRPIWVTLTPVTGNGRDVIQIVIEDESEGVDVENLRPLPREGNETRPGGLGMHIIQQTMDEVKYQRRPEGRGVRLTLRKYVNGTTNTSGATGSAGHD